MGGNVKDYAADGVLRKDRPTGSVISQVRGAALCEQIGRRCRRSGKVRWPRAGCAGGNTINSVSMRSPWEKPMANSKNKQKVKRKLHKQKRLRRIKRRKAAAAAK